MAAQLASATASFVRFTRVVTGIAPNLRSFVWALKELRSVHRRLPVDGTRTRVPAAEGMGPRGWWGVRCAIAALNPTCLERALLLQAWRGGYTEAPDVVIGVRKGVNDVEAHAWVERNDPWFDPTYAELTRLTP